MEDLDVRKHINFLYKNLSILASLTLSLKRTQPFSFSLNFKCVTFMFFFTNSNWSIWTCWYLIAFYLPNTGNIQWFKIHFHYLNFHHHSRFMASPKPTRALPTAYQDITIDTALASTPLVSNPLDTILHTNTRTVSTCTGFDRDMPCCTPISPIPESLLECNWSLVTFLKDNLKSALIYQKGNSFSNLIIYFY